MSSVAWVCHSCRRAALAAAQRARPPRPNAISNPRSFTTTPAAHRRQIPKPPRRVKPIPSHSHNAAQIQFYEQEDPSTSPVYLGADPTTAATKERENDIQKMEDELSDRIFSLFPAELPPEKIDEWSDEELERRIKLLPKEEQDELWSLISVRFAEDPRERRVREWMKENRVMNTTPELRVHKDIINAVVVSMRPSEARHPRLLQLNICLRNQALVDTWGNRRALWRAYIRAKEGVKRLGRRIPQEAWECLWFSQELMDPGQVQGGRRGVRAKLKSNDLEAMQAQEMASNGRLPSEGQKYRMSEHQQVIQMDMLAVGVVLPKELPGWEKIVVPEEIPEDIDAAVQQQEVLQDEALVQLLADMEKETGVKLDDIPAVLEEMEANEDEPQKEDQNEAQTECEQDLRREVSAEERRRLDGLFSSLNIDSLNLPDSQDVIRATSPTQETQAKKPSPEEERYHDIINGADSFSKALDAELLRRGTDPKESEKRTAHVGNEIDSLTSESEEADKALYDSIPSRSEDADFTFDYKNMDPDNLTQEDLRAVERRLRLFRDMSDEDLANFGEGGKKEIERRMRDMQKRVDVGMAEEDRSRGKSIWGWFAGR